MRVFVYGTLRAGQRNARLVEPYVTYAEPGVVAGTLYEGPGFPYATPDGDGLICGEWLSVVPGKEKGALERLDILEGYGGPGGRNHYERVWVHDAKAPDIDGWIYVAGPCARPGHRIEGGDWVRTQNKARLDFAPGNCVQDSMAPVSTVGAESVPRRRSG